MAGRPAMTLASQVCWNCKNGKRKCSKELPSCARCAKLLLRCDYDWTAGNAPESSGAQSKASPASSIEVHTPPSLQSASRLLHSLSHGSPKSSGGEANIPSQVLSILIANGENVQSVTALYFRTIDVWLPIISPRRCVEKLENIASDNNPELSNLLLCMYLVTRQPGKPSGIKEMQTPIYFEAKTLLTTLTSSGNLSIEVIQAGVLLSLYEQGHGMIDVAQLTMSVCTRMAMKMKVALRAAPELQNTDFGRLWWGLVILDRHLNQILSPEEIQLTVGSSSDGVPSMELPVDDEAHAGLIRPITMRTISGISAASRPTTRLGPFCRASEAAHLLGKVLDLVARSSYTNEMDEAKSRELDASLQTLAMSLMQLAVNGWEECCAAIGLALSALLLLHVRTWELIRGSPGHDDRREIACMALSSTTRMVIDISRRFHMDLAFIDLPALPLPATYAVYRAAMLYIDFAGDEFLGPEWSENMKSLRGTLEYFGKRWNVGKHYLDLVDIALAEKKKACSATERDAGEFHGAHELLRDMNISRG